MKIIATQLIQVEAKQRTIVDKKPKKLVKSRTQHKKLKKSIVKKDDDGEVGDDDIDDKETLHFNDNETKSLNAKKSEILTKPVNQT
jgi:hypothetical protein